MSPEKWTVLGGNILMGGTKMDCSYKIINSYYTIDEGNGYSIQLNRIEWNKNAPKYDLRRWKDGKPLKGFSMTERVFDELLNAMVKLAPNPGNAESDQTDENKKVNSNKEAEDNQHVLGTMSRFQILEALSESRYSERHLRIEEVIENGAVRNYLLRNGIKTLEDLIKAIEDDSIHSLRGFTKNKEDRVYDSLKAFVLRPVRTNVELVRPMFTDINELYINLPIYSLQVFVNRRKTLDLLDGMGYKKIGDLSGMLESSLECIVGISRMDMFLNIEQILKNDPEEIIAGIWNNSIDSRKGRIVLNRSRGMALQEIADGIGVSRERVRQIVLRFYDNQGVFLQLIENSIVNSENEKAAIKQAFPNITHRRLFRLWRTIQDPHSPIDALLTEDAQDSSDLSESELNKKDKSDVRESNRIKKLSVDNNISFIQQYGITLEVYKKYMTVGIAEPLLSHRLCGICDKVGILTLGNLMNASMSLFEKCAGFGPSCKIELEGLLDKLSKGKIDGSNTKSADVLRRISKETVDEEPYGYSEDEDEQLTFWDIID